MSSSFPTKLVLLHSDFICKGYSISGLRKKGLTLPLLIYNILLDYDISLHNLVELVVTIPTSPRSSKTESGCKSYDRFRFEFSAVFLLPVVPMFEPVVPTRPWTVVPGLVPG